MTVILVDQARSVSWARSRLGGIRRIEGEHPYAYFGAILYRLAAEHVNLATPLCARRSMYRTRPAWAPIFPRRRRTICPAERLRRETPVYARVKYHKDMLARDAEKLCKLGFCPGGGWNHILPQQGARMCRAPIQITLAEP
jgi:hypothetical protein